MNINAELVGRIIQEYRQQSGLSQEVVSGLAGLDRTHYSKIERGERMPTIITLFKIAQAMNIYPSDIIKTIEKTTEYKCERDGF